MKKVERLNQIVETGAKWVADNGDDSESLKDFPTVAASVMQAEMLLAQIQKETAGDAAVVINMPVCSSLSPDEIVAKISGLLFAVSKRDNIIGENMGNRHVVSVVA